MKKLTLILFGIGLAFQLIAQPIVRISGQITDRQTGEPLPFVHIKLKDQAYGTVANVDGHYALQVPAFQPIVLLVSLVGYVPIQLTYDQLTTNLNLNLKMKQSQMMLHEVVVTPKNYELKLLKAAINNIPRNYPSEVEVLKAFVRNRADKSPKKSYYVIELTERIQKQSYEKPVRGGEVQVVESQKIEFESLDSLGVRFYSGSHIGHWGDLVAQRSAVLNLDDLGNYELELVDTLAWTDGFLYEVKFWPKHKGASGSGAVYIHDESYAIPKMKLHYNEKECNSGIREILNGYNRTYRDFETDYVFDGEKWRLGSIRYQTSFDKNGKTEIELVDELLITGLDSSSEIDYQDRFNYHNVLLQEVEPYDADYWAEENSILPSAELNDALAQNKVRPEGNVSKAEKIMAFVQRLSFKYGFGLNDVARQSTVVTFGAQDYEIDESKSWVPTLGSSITYELANGLKIGYLSQSSLQASLLRSTTLILNYDLPFNTSGRPFYLSPEIGLGYMHLSKKLATISKEEYSGEVADRFDADRSDLYLQSRFVNLVPKLTLSIEKSSRFRFYLDGGYNIPVSTRLGLHVVEDQFFLKRKSLFLEEGSGAVSFSEAGAFTSNWQVGIGVMFSY